MEFGVASFNLAEPTRPAHNLGDESLAGRFIFREGMQYLDQSLLVRVVALPFSFDVDLVQQHEREIPARTALPCAQEE